MSKRYSHLLVIFSALILAPHACIRAQPAAHVIYTNKQYGFTFTLPASWKGYTIVTGTWQGTATKGPPPAPTSIEHGPALRIRNPQWTQDDPHEDIPIWIFTPDQWNRVQDESLIVSAAPFPPDELGHNARFVFALPARYSYDNLTGVEEVLKINANHPLHAF
jgi:hypothetical protein